MINYFIESYQKYYYNNGNDYFFGIFDDGIGMEHHKDAFTSGVDAEELKNEE